MGHHARAARACYPIPARMLPDTRARRRAAWHGRRGHAPVTRTARAQAACARPMQPHAHVVCPCPRASPLLLEAKVGRGGGCADPQHQHTPGGMGGPPWPAKHARTVLACQACADRPGLPSMGCPDHASAASSAGGVGGQVRTAGYGANLLLNVGPMVRGGLERAQRERERERERERLRERERE
jgi:hypothetical protein